MPDKTDFMADAVINTHLVGQTVKVHLFTAGWVELSGGGYQPVEGVFFVRSGPGHAVNSVDIVFPQSSEDWADAVGAGVADDAGNLKYRKLLPVAVTIRKYTQFKILAGQLSILEE